VQIPPVHSYILKGIAKSAMLDEVYLLANKGKKEIIKEQFGSKTANKILLELLYQEKIVLANFQFLLTLQKLLLAIISLVISIK
jgi:hypothetical protein